MKVPPPFCAACTGKRRKLPRPTAFPAMARINAIQRSLLLGLSTFAVLVGLVVYFAGRLPPGTVPWILLLSARALLVAVLSVLALWLLALGLRRFLFRVGRKLAFSYFLIGVLPIPMVTLLIGLNAYLLSGYFVGHLYRDTVQELKKDLVDSANLALADAAESEIVS